MRVLGFLIVASAAPLASSATATGGPTSNLARAAPDLPDVPLSSLYWQGVEPADASTLILDQQQAPAGVEDIWQPAPTPRGGVSWALLESTQETTRLVEGVIYSRPVFPASVRALAGRRIRIAGYMMPLENAPAQRHFVLLGYPPGCPFHFHALPNQFIEIYAEEPVPLNETDATIVSGVLELTGEDESGVFFRLRSARAERG